MLHKWTTRAARLDPDRPAAAKLVAAAAAVDSRSDGSTFDRCFAAGRLHARSARSRRLQLDPILPTHHHPIECRPEAGGAAGREAEGAETPTTAGHRAAEAAVRRVHAAEAETSRLLPSPMR